MIQFKYTLIVAILLSFAACKTPNQEQLNEIVEEGKFEKSELIDQIETLATDTNFMKHLRFGDTLSHFYKDHKFKPVWSLYLINDSMARPVMNRLYLSREEGFKPAYYRFDSINNMLARLRDKKVTDVYGELAKVELLISDNMLSFHRDRVMGRTDPNVVFEGTYLLPGKKYEGFELMEVLDYERYDEVLDKNTHTDTAYLYLQDLLKSYLNRMDEGEEWFQIDTTGIRKLEPGDTTTLMPEIARKLVQMKVITEKEAEEASPNRYEKSFAKYVRRFQQRYGLYDDAIFGRKTFGLLNTSIEDRINEISANLERLRWTQLPNDESFISVNLASFELTLSYIDSVNIDSVKTMAVCIGKARPHDYDERVKRAKEEGKYWLKPADHETPQIYSKVAYMVVNPTWNVPRSIITREMWWRMRSDSMYLANANYGVFYKKKEIRSDTINWRLYKPNRMPFEIIQKSGDDNALGRVKFIFPNKFSIYLHDTPQKSKFKWSERAVSHGCVRVQNPLLLGEFLTRNIDTLESDDFRIMMGYPPLDEERLEDYDPKDSTAKFQKLEKTMLIRLNKQMPVYFLYRTIYFDQDWNVQYRNDVYRKNRYIIEAMNF